MFDIGFSELLVIGVVALVVLGPERLPKVARTAGHLVGRLQRYMAAVKADMEREGHLRDLHDLRQQFETSKSEVEKSIQQTAQAVKTEATEQAQTIHAPLEQAKQEIAGAVAPAASEPAPAVAAPITPAVAATTPPSSEKSTG